MELKTQPKEKFTILELPVKTDEGGRYFVWNGEKWIELIVKN